MGAKAVPLSLIASPAFLLLFAETISLPWDGQFWYTLG